MRNESVSLSLTRSVAARQPFCYEMRVDNTWGILEAEYVAEKGTWDDNFLIEGLRPGGSSAGA